MLCCQWCWQLVTLAIRFMIHLIQKRRKETFKIAIFILIQITLIGVLLMLSIQYFTITLFMLSLSIQYFYVFYIYLLLFFLMITLIQSYKVNAMMVYFFIGCRVDKTIIKVNYNIWYCSPRMTISKRQIV